MDVKCPCGSKERQDKFRAEKSTEDQLKIQKPLFPQEAPELKSGLGRTLVWLHVSVLGLLFSKHWQDHVFNFSQVFS